MFEVDREGFADRGWDSGAGTGAASDSASRCSGSDGVRDRFSLRDGDSWLGPGQVQPTASGAATTLFGCRHDFLRFVHEVILVAGGTPEVKGKSAFGRSLRDP